MTGGRPPLDGRTALVTGGEGFLGRRWISVLLLDAGATVISVDVVESESAGGELARPFD